MATYTCVVAPSDPGGYDYHYTSLSAAFSGVADDLGTAPYDLSTSNDKITFYLSNGDYSEAEVQIVERFTSDFNFESYFTGGDGTNAYIHVTAASGQSAAGRYRGGTSQTAYNFTTSGNLAAPTLYISTNFVDILARGDGTLISDIIFLKTASGLILYTDHISNLKIAVRRCTFVNTGVSQGRALDTEWGSFTPGSNTESCGDFSFNLSYTDGNECSILDSFDPHRIINNTIITADSTAACLDLEAAAAGEICNNAMFSLDTGTGSTTCFSDSAALTAVIHIKNNASLTDDSAHVYDSEADPDPVASGNLGTSTDGISISGDLEDWSGSGDFRPKSTSDLGTEGLTYSGMLITLCGDTPTYPDGTALPTQGGSSWPIGAAPAAAGGAGPVFVPSVIMY